MFYDFEFEYADLTNETDRRDVMLLERFELVRPIDILLWAGDLEDNPGRIQSLIVAFGHPNDSIDEW